MIHLTLSPASPETSTHSSEYSPQYEKPPDSPQYEKPPDSPRYGKPPRVTRKFYQDSPKTSLARPTENLFTKIEVIEKKINSLEARVERQLQRRRAERDTQHSILLIAYAATFSSILIYLEMTQK